VSEPGRNTDMLVVGDLVVKYGRMTAIQVDELRVPHGRVLVVGPNGSGKTTLIKAVLGLIRPSRGVVRVLGLDPFRDSRELFKRVTYVRDIDELPGNLRLSTLIGVLEEYYGGDSVRQVVEELGLAGHEDKRLSELSRGMRRKASLLPALASNRSLIIIDEPFSGLDSKSRMVVSRLLDSKKADMIIVSHMQLNMRFDHLVLVESARITYSGPFKELEWYKSIM